MSAFPLELARLAIAVSRPAPIAKKTRISGKRGRFAATCHALGVSCGAASASYPRLASTSRSAARIALRASSSWSS
jgi:hypothetical protein